MGNIYSGIAEILPVFKKALHTHHTHTYTPLYVNRWRNYNLTINGRMNVAKALLLSQYTYVATVLTSL